MLGFFLWLCQCFFFKHKNAKILKKSQWFSGTIAQNQAPVPGKPLWFPEHSQPTIFNEALMEGERGRLPAFLSAPQSAHVMRGGVGSAAASSPSLAHPRKTTHCCGSAQNHESHFTTPEWLWHNENQRIWSQRSRDLTQSFFFIQSER